MSAPPAPAVVVGAESRLIMSAEREREMYQRRMPKQATETMVLPGAGSHDQASKGSKGSDDHVNDPTGEGDGDHFTESDDEVESP